MQDTTNKLEVVESKLRGDITQTEELLNIAIEHKTPFINALTQKLEENQLRLAQLIELRNRNYAEQEVYAFLTPTEREAFVAIERVLDPERLRLNLLLISLYLTAFEVLTYSIIQQTDDFLVPIPVDDSHLPPQLSNKQFRDRMISEYKQEVGVKFSTPPNYKLIPLCKWLQKNGVLSSEEIDEIKEIRVHRNNLAHKLPELILSDVDLVINLDHFMRIRELIRKIQLFWIRIDMDIKGMNEDVADEDISGGWGVLDLIITTVLDYVNTPEDNK